jgi:hypothetical protein
MKYKMLATLFIGSLISFTAYAADDKAAADKATDDENTVVGACMIQKFQNNTPAISQATIDKCADVEANDAPKCLGLSDEQYTGYVKFCVAQLINAKCVAGKMNVPLIKYADCGYEQDPAACYKELGYTPDAIVKLSTDCQKETT